MKKIESKTEINELVNEFYSKVRADDLIGPIFNDLAKVNWDDHIPKISDFWDALLFGAENYNGRPFPPHIPLNLKPEHFQRWLSLFFQTVDELFVGQKADEIKMRSMNIARNFMGNLERLSQNVGK